MTRWKVERGFSWVAMLLDEQGREITGTAKRFPTHAEALAYADRESRTIEVELPRPSAVLSNGTSQWCIEGLIVTPAFDGNPHRTMLSPHPIMSIPNHLRIPLALALLAHHYIEQECTGSTQHTPRTWPVSRAYGWGEAGK